MCRDGGTRQGMGATKTETDINRKRYIAIAAAILLVIVAVLLILLTRCVFMQDGLGTGDKTAGVDAAVGSQDPQGQSGQGPDSGQTGIPQPQTPTAPPPDSPSQPPASGTQPPAWTYTPPVTPPVTPPASGTPTTPPNNGTSPPDNPPPNNPPPDNPPPDETPEPSKRPIIKDGTVLSSSGTRLRGAAWGVEANDPGTFIPTPDEFSDYTQNGLNALHVYVESYQNNLPIGSSAWNCDYMVEHSSKNGMYVIITIGCVNTVQDEEGNWIITEEDAQFIYDFWEFYAGRYADNEYVIYEICNEMPTLGNVAEIEANAYKIIRKYAPDTMVLFYSPAAIPMIYEGEEYIYPYIEETVRLIGEEQLWDNAAVAFHGYIPYGNDFLRESIREMARRGYPMIDTEVPNRLSLTPYPDTVMLRLLEEEGLSWIAFSNDISNPSHWRGQFEAAGLTWQPDFGDWPVTDAVYPFGDQSAYDTAGAASSASKLIDGSDDVCAFLSGDTMVLNRLNFGTREPLSLSLKLRSPGGTVTVREGGATGRVLGSRPVLSTSGLYLDVTVDILNAVSGLPNVCITYESQSGTMLLKSWRFNLPSQTLYGDPGRSTVHAADYPFRSGDIVRMPNTDAASSAKYQVGGITNGSSLKYDYVIYPYKNMVLHMRIKNISGGDIRIFGGDTDYCFAELGEQPLSVSGGTGEWLEYSYPLYYWIGGEGYVSGLYEVDPHYDLWFEFSGGTGELFEISDFWFSY